MKKILLGVLAFVLCLGIGLTFTQAAEVKTSNCLLAETAQISSVLSVFGEAEIEVTPNLAKINVSIENVDMDVKIAKDNTFATFNKAQEKLEGIGVAKEKIIVESFSTYPNYDYTCGRKLSGYYATINFSFQIEDMEKVKSVIDVLTESGITNINNIDYTISNESEVYNNVLIKALENAKIKAQRLLSRDDLSLVKVNEEYVYYSSNLMRSYSSGYDKQDMVGKVTIKAKVCAQFN